MNIEQYISQLLYRYQCVTVTGFGAFLTEIQSAQLIEVSNTFFPPQKVVSFNANIKNNDGLLANHIAVTCKTSYEFATSAIEQQVITWKRNLENEGSIAIKNVGNFAFNTDGNLIFTPFDQINYLTNSFGLSSFVSPEVKRALFEQKIESLAQNIEESTVIELVTNTTRTSSYLKYAAVLVLGLGIMGGIGYPLYEQQISNEIIIVEQSVQKKVQNKIQEATFLIKNPIPSVTLSLKEEKMSYHIMAGAFKEEKNAQTKFEQLSRQGFKARRIAQNKYGLFPVLYGSYATYAEAEKVKNEIQKNDNPDAWVLVENL